MLSSWRRLDDWKSFEVEIAEVWVSSQSGGRSFSFCQNQCFFALLSPSMEQSQGEEIAGILWENKDNQTAKTAEIRPTKLGEDCVQPDCAVANPESSGWKKFSTIQRSICCSIRVIFCRASSQGQWLLGVQDADADMSRSIPRLAIKSWKKIRQIWRNQSGNSRRMISIDGFDEKERSFIRKTTWQGRIRLIINWSISWTRNWD